MEEAVYQQALGHLVTNNFIDKFQSGFRPAHSTTTTLVRVYDDIKSGIDNGLVTILILFDFTQAFPSIVHVILFHKMRVYGFSKSIICWFRPFLLDRSQCVRVGESRSSWRPVHRRVPQGFPLASLCFSTLMIYLPSFNTADTTWTSTTCKFTFTGRPLSFLLKKVTEHFKKVTKK